MIKILLGFFISIGFSNVFAQKKDSTFVYIPNTLSLSEKGRIQDGVLLKTSADSLKFDSVRLSKKSKNAITDRIDWKSQDSITLDLKTKKAYLYNKAEIKYQNIELKADYVESGFESKVLVANGVPDSNGELHGTPVFKEGGQEYEAKKITYNFNTKKGIINEVIIVQGDGFLHGEKVKKIDDSTMFLSKGCYTTCNLQEHPHFGIEFSKSKVLLGDRVITGPAYLTIEDVPTPLVIPFGFFPFSKKRSSGIIIPMPGYEKRRGYNLKGGGYYFALSDYYDLLLKGNIYTNLSWLLSAKSDYYKRYKFKGNLEIVLEKNIGGIKGTSDYSNEFDFSIHWSHEQDPKANPNSNFSASVDFVSPTYSKWATNTYSYATSTTTSKITYSRRLGSGFNLSAGVSESYNTNTKIYAFDFPSANINSKQFFPLRSKKPVGRYKWYEDISVQYTMNMLNRVQSPDSLLLTSDIWKRMNNGIEQKISVSSSINVLKYFNWNNGINYTERWYLKSIRKTWNTDSNRLQTDTIWGFASNRQADFSSSLQTKVYGIFNLKNKYLKAIRHVMTPSLNFNFNPDFGDPAFGFWKSYTDFAGIKHDYSVFENSTHGYPQQGRSGRVGLSLGNNLEIKVRSKSDTVTGMKKIKLIESLTFSMNYDFAKDSLRLSNLNVSGWTTLFENITINYSGSFNPYCIDSLGKSYNTLLWTKEKKLFKRTNSSWTLSLNWNLSSQKMKKEEQDAKPVADDVPYMSPFANPNILFGNTVDFNIPWNVNIRYSLRYNSDYIGLQRTYNNTVTQTLDVFGDFNLTQRWKIGFTGGYDFTMKEVTPPTFDVYADLHCWEMRVSWIPFGYLQGWNFTIGVKAGSLKDLKYEMKNETRYSQPML